MFNMVVTDSVLCTHKSHTKTKIRRNKVFNKTYDGEVQDNINNNQQTRTQRTGTDIGRITRG